MADLTESSPLAAAAIAAIRAGDVPTLERLLRDNPALSTSTIVRPAQQVAGRCVAHEFRYPLIWATADWPGHFPRVAACIAALVAAGANVDASSEGPHGEVALHAAASCDDIEALDALLDAGANIEAPGAVIAGGTPLDDAVAFAQWRAARRLVERGARTALWHSAALGLMDRVRDHFAAGRPLALYPWGGRGLDAQGELNVALWCAAHGAQREAATFLLELGAERAWVSPWDHLTPAAAARRSGALELADWLEHED